MKYWKDIVVKPTATIREAMRTIDDGSMKIAFVLNADGNLIGSVTDGDIRRGLIESAQMDDLVTQVMNKEPITCQLGLSKEKQKQLLTENNVTYLPVLDGQLMVDVVTECILDEYEVRNNAVFIMAGGFGTRLRPLTNNCPKPMLHLGEQPILEHLIEQLSSQGFRNFYLSTHFMPEVIEEYFGNGENWGVNIYYIYEEYPLGTGGALGLLPDSLVYPMIMLNGDVLTDLDFTKLLDYHVASKFDATMCVRELEHQVSYGVVEAKNALVTRLIEKPTYRHDINTGIYVVSQEFVRSVREGERIDMPTQLEYRISCGEKVGVLRHSGYWLDVGRMSDYQKAQRDIFDVFGKGKF